jgi:hypothetical protein
MASILQRDLFQARDTAHRNKDDDGHLEKFLPMTRRKRDFLLPVCR